MRTFPTLALVGAILYLLDPTRLIPFTTGLAIIGAWLVVYYRERIREPDEGSEQSVGLMVLLLNVFAYLLGGIAIALPHWVSVGTTVVGVLLFTGRERLHALARGIEVKEIVTAAQFLLLTGLVLPLLPNQPVTALTSITPRQAWLALVVVCTLSYASYLVQRYATPLAGGPWMALLGGMYSSTATTLVLARQAKSEPELANQAQAGITLASGIMYVRILVVVAAFNPLLARTLAPALGALSLAAFGLAAFQYRRHPASAATERRMTTNQNPLELGPAVVFSLSFIAVSVLSSVLTSRFGTNAIYWFAAAVGFTDIDPFVLNLAQGGTRGLSMAVIAAAVLIAASSNNVLKAAYATAFAGWRRSAVAVASLAILAAGGLGIAAVLAR